MIIRRISITLLSILIFSSLSFSQEFVPGKILVKFNKDIELKSDYSLKTAAKLKSLPLNNDLIEILSEAKVTQMKSLYGQNPHLHKSSVFKKSKELNTYILTCDPKADILQISQELHNHSEVVYAEPDYYFYANFTPNDSNIGDQWYLTNVQAFDVWDVTTGSGQIIAILDTGVDTTHTELANQTLTGYDFVNNDNAAMDDNMHGTHVAGIAAAQGNNSSGMAGIAYGAQILPVKVLQSSGRGASSTITQGVEYAVNQGATVINMSLGSPIESLTLRDALAIAYSYTTIVAAAGNNGLAMIQEGVPSVAIYPACYSFVLGVEATKSNNTNAQFSNFDPTGPISYTNSFGYNYEIKAPGEGIYSTIPGETYRSINGTSMASPMVAGAVALMKANDNSLSNDEIFARLIQSGAANGGVLQIRDAIDHTLTPDLYFQSVKIIDTVPNNVGDGDFKPDAGEHIGLIFNIKNAGGPADDVFVKLSLGQFEDPAVATIITDSINMGDIGIYGTLDNSTNQLVFSIASNVVHDRDIVLHYEIGAANTTTRIEKDFTIRVTNADELVGILTGTQTLTANKLWIVQNSFRVASTGTLNIDPGAQLILEKKIVNEGTINGNGTANNRISIKGPKGIESTGMMNFNYTDFSTFLLDEYLIHPMNIDTAYFDNCSFSDVTIDHNVGFFKTSGLLEFEDCTFKGFLNNSGLASIFRGNGKIRLFESNFDNMKGPFLTFGSTGDFQAAAMNFVIYNCVFSRINTPEIFINGINNGTTDTISGTAFIGGKITFDGSSGWSTTPIAAHEYTLMYGTDAGINESVVNNYWGTSDSIKIQNYVYDFWDNASLAIANYSPFLSTPSDDAHGFLWKVTINDKDVQDEQFDPVGVEQLKFIAYFNRAMDTTNTPFLSFGLREPFTQNVVHENASWSADSTIWTAYFDIDNRIEDGINYIRVSGAIDDDGFEIPIEENMRFSFITQTSSGLSSNLSATPGLGKVDLSWSQSLDEDILGFNVYRASSYVQDASTKAGVVINDTIKINESLILDANFEDAGGSTDTTYYYMIRALNANFAESAFSNAVTARPQSGSVISLSGDLTFGDVRVNENKTDSLFINNTGNTSLSVSGISYPSGFSGDWSSGTISAGGSQKVTVTFAPTAVSNYSGSIIVTSDANSGTNTVNISGNGIDNTTGIEDLEFSNSIKLYPNPVVGDEVNIIFKNQDNGNILLQLLDSNGKLIDSYHFRKNSNDFEFDLPLANTVSGIYYIVIVQDNKKSIKKLIKK